MATEPDHLVAWIAELRGRVAHGELDDLDAMAVGDGTLPVALVARILLADLDHDRALTPERRRSQFNVERRRALFADLRRLRDRFG